jgi:hypothetical protein
MVGGLGSLTLVANTIFAPLIAEEQLTWSHVWATMMIVLGCSVVVGYGPHTNEVYTPPQLWRIITSAGFITFMVLILGGGVLLHLTLSDISSKVEFFVEVPAKRHQRRRKRRGSSSSSVGKPHPTEEQSRFIAARSQHGQPPFVQTQSGLVLDYSRINRPWMSFHIHRSGFPVLAAIFGALNVLFAKIL